MVPPRHYRPRTISPECVAGAFRQDTITERFPHSCYPNYLSATRTVYVDSKVWLFQHQPSLPEDSGTKISDFATSHRWISHAKRTQQRIREFSGRSPHSFEH